jgi:DNA-binding LacI/PurR family transcriptional regulator
MTRKPVMTDVARLAGVAAITVSRVVNGDPAVTEATRARVQQAIDALGYRSNTAARTLAGGRSKVLGVISVETEHYGPSHALFGIERAARASGHAVNFVTVRAPSVDELRNAFDRLREAQVEGVIVIAPVREVMDVLTHVHPDVPFVVTSSVHGVDNTVSIDQARGARLATAHLLDLGHRTVHHVRGPHGWLDADARVEGWRKQLRTAKRAVPEPLVGDWTARSGYVAGQLLSKDLDVTAVFVANDHMALGMMLALHAAGRRVPNDVSVIGFDDAPESEFFNPPLTTIRQDLNELGRRGVDMLLATIAGEPTRRVVIKPTFVFRASTERWS